MTLMAIVLLILTLAVLAAHLRIDALRRDLYDVEQLLRDGIEFPYLGDE